MQIIVCALAFGIVMFAGVTLFMESQNAQPRVPAEPLISYAAIVLAIAVAVAWMIVPGIIAARMRQSLIDGRLADMGLVKNLPNAAELGDVAQLSAIFQTRLIIGAALLEGAAFLAVTAYMMEHQRFTLYIAGVLLLVILSQIPTVSRVEAWIEGELATVQQMRQMR